MSLLGKAFKFAARSLAGIATGGASEALIAAGGVASRLASRVGGARPSAMLTSPAIVGGGGGVIRTSGILIGAQTVAAGGGVGAVNLQGTGLAPSDATQLPALAGQACPIGYRANKSTYITRGGGTSRWGPSGTIIVHAKHSTCVKRRRRNVGNAKALRRAISRVKGFVKLARRAHALVGPHRRSAGRGARGTSVEVVRAG